MKVAFKKDYFINLFKNINKKMTITSVLFLLTLAMVYSAIYNIPYFVKLGHTTSMVILLFIASILRNFIIWYVAFLNRWVFAFFTAFTFIVSGGLYYLYKYVHIGLNIGTFELVLSTNLVEAAGVINPTLIRLFITGFIISLIFIIIRFKFINIKKLGGGGNLLILIISLIMLIFGLLPEKSLKHEASKLRIESMGNVGSAIEMMPEKIYENFYHFTRNKIRMKYMHHKRKTLVVPNVTNKHKDSEKIVVFVLSDALRADHLHINGYERKTVPYMEKNNFISFKEMYACETATTRSVPCLLTDMRRRSPRYDFLNKYSIFNIFNAAGYYTAFISAQTAITTADDGQKLIALDADYTYFNNDYSIQYDKELLKYFDDVMANDSKNKLIVLQLNGSHWNYNDRFKKEDALYLPLCDKFALDCPVENLINSYDNTIIETDKLLNTIVNKLKDKDAIIFLSSDHGQSLGEGGLRLHSHERLHIKEVGVVPFAIWVSDKAKESVDTNIINDNLNKILTHDSVFHSIIGCADITTDVLDNTLNVCSKSLISAPNEFENYKPKPLQ